MARQRSAPEYLLLRPRWRGDVNRLDRPYTCPALVTNHEQGGTERCDELLDDRARRVLRADDHRHTGQQRLAPEQRDECRAFGGTARSQTRHIE